MLGRWQERVLDQLLAAVGGVAGTVLLDKNGAALELLGLLRGQFRRLVAADQGCDGAVYGQRQLRQQGLEMAGDLCVEQPIDGQRRRSGLHVQLDDQRVQRLGDAGGDLQVQGPGDLRLLLLGSRRGRAAHELFRLVPDMLGGDGGQVGL